MYLVNASYLSQKASSPNMIYHAMSLIKAATDYINSVESPIITIDQPLCGIAKSIQWDPAIIEDNHCVFLGPFYSEMLIGKLLGIGYETVDRRKCLLMHFKYWLTVYDMKLLLLRFVSSITRIEYFDLYLRLSGKIADWAFILDHYNYAIWLPAEYTKSADKTPGSLQSLR